MGAGVTCWIKEVFEKTLWEAFGGNASQEMLFRGALHLCTLSSSASTSQPCLCPCLCSRLATHHRWSLFKKWKKHTQPILKVLLALKIKAPYAQAAGAKGQAQGKVSREQKGKEVHRKGTRTSCFPVPSYEGGQQYQQKVSGQRGQALYLSPAEDRTQAMVPLSLVHKVTCITGYSRWCKQDLQLHILRFLINAEDRQTAQFKQGKTTAIYRFCTRFG